MGPGVPVPWCVSHGPIPGHCLTELLPSFDLSSANSAEINTSSSVSNRASTVYLMCQEMLSNDYKLHNSIPSLSSLSLNHGSLWCKYKLLQAPPSDFYIYIFGGAVVSSGTSQVWNLCFACPLKSVITLVCENSEDLLSMHTICCTPESQGMSQSCLWTFPSWTCGLRCWTMKDSPPVLRVLVPTWQQVHQGFVCHSLFHPALGVLGV